MTAPPDGGREGRGDRGAAPPARGARPPVRPAPLPPGRPNDPGDLGEATAPRPLADLPGHPVDPITVAPRVDPPTLDLPRQRPTPPGVGLELASRVLRLARENPRWGYCASSASAESSAYWYPRRRCAPSRAAT